MINKKIVRMVEDKNGNKKPTDWITVVGNLTKDLPEAKEVTANGKEVFVLNSRDASVACDVGKDETVFYSFTVWGNQAKFFERLKKGDRVTFDGRVESQTYTYEKDGKTHTSPPKDVIIVGYDSDIEIDTRVMARLADEKKKSGTVEPEMEIDGEDVPF